MLGHRVVVLVALHAMVSSGDRTACVPGEAHGKKCPDYGEAGEFCCPSRVQVGDFYCCSAEQLEQRKQERLAAERREFMRKNLPVILGASLGGFALVFCVVVAVCLKVRSCPVYRWRHEQKRRLSCDASLSPGPATVAASGPSSRYHPVRTVEPKPSLYDAPPPYTSSPEYPTRPPEQRWDYQKENQLNAKRQTLRAVPNASPTERALS